MSSWNIFRRY